MAAVVLCRPPQVARVEGVRDDVALVRAAVRHLRERVCPAEADALREAARDVDLQSVIERIRIVAGDADGAEALVWAQRVHVETAALWVARDQRALTVRAGSHRQLVNVAFALAEQTAPADVADFDCRVPGDLA